MCVVMHNKRDLGDFFFWLLLIFWPSRAVIWATFFMEVKNKCTSKYKKHFVEFCFFEFAMRISCKYILLEFHVWEFIVPPTETEDDWAFKKENMEILCQKTSSAIFFQIQLFTGTVCLEKLSEIKNEQMNLVVMSIVDRF